MNRRSLLCVFTVFCWPLAVGAQSPEPAAEYKILQQDVGTWKATLKFWLGPDGKADATVEPMTSEGMEVNRMLGPYWLVSEFKGEFGGMPFEGQSLNGYDPETKKYTGRWVDSVSPNPMQLSGSYDAKTETLTSTTHGIGMDGEPITGKAVVVYDGDDARRMTMYEMVDGKQVKSMEVVYRRVKP